MPQKLCNSLHLGGNRGVILVEVRMVSARINDAETVAHTSQIKIELFDTRRRGVLEIYGDKAADGARRLIHKSAGLAEIDVLGELSRFCDLHIVDRAVVVQMAEHVSYHDLKRR